jgi:ABC-type multidrug transport system fused ATPase/permease subunit
LYDPQVGIIKLNNQDISQITIGELREKVGMVTQDVQLFHGTVRDNLTFFDNTIPDATILKVINELGLHRWYKKFKHGLATYLSPSSHGLSAGEAQLLAFIRIFLKNPGVVILDEASSRLDRATEELLQRATNTLLHNRTGIIIAHRLATIMHVDKIMMLDNGKIIEYGDRKKLMKDPHSAFAQLLKSGQKAGIDEVLA